MPIELNQGINNLEVVGTLKEKSLEHSLNGNGSDVIRGYVVVEWKRGERVQNTRINVYAPESSRSGKHMKSYDSISKVETEYKDKDSFGSEADRIRISGDVQWNPYLSKSTSEIRQTLRLTGKFFHRIDASDTSIQDHALAQLTLSIGGYQPILKDGIDTGDRRVSALNIGYGSRVNIIPNLVVTQEAFGDEVDDFTELFTKGTTGLFTVMFNNYTTVKETTEESHGFGHAEQMSTAVDYVNNVEIIYSDGNVFDPETRGLTTDQFKHALELRDQKLAELKADNGNPIQHPATPARGFGNAPASQATTPAPTTNTSSITDDIPDFSF